MPVHVAEKHELSAALQHPNRARKKGSKFRNSCFNRSRGKKFSKCWKSINKKVKNAVLTWQPQTVVSFGPEFWSIEPVSSRIDEREWFWFFYKPVCSHLVSISYLRHLLFRFCWSRIIEREIGPSSKQWETHLVSSPFYDICSAGSIDPGNLWEGPISILLQSSEFLNLYEAFNCDIISLQFQPMKSSSKLETLLWVCIFTQKSQKLWLVGSDLGTLVLPFRQQTGEGYELFCSLLFDNILMQGFGVAITTRL